MSCLASLPRRTGAVVVAALALAAHAALCRRRNPALDLRRAPFEARR